MNPCQHTPHTLEPLHIQAPHKETHLQLVIPVVFRPWFNQCLLVIKHCALCKYPNCYKLLLTNTQQIHTKPSSFWHSVAPSIFFLSFREPQVAQLAVMCSNCWQCCPGKDTLGGEGVSLALTRRYKEKETVRAKMEKGENARMTGMNGIRGGKTTANIGLKMVETR